MSLCIGFAPCKRGRSCRFFTAMCVTRSDSSSAAPNTTPPPSSTYLANSPNAPPPVDWHRSWPSPLHTAKHAGSVRGSRCFRTGQMCVQCPHCTQPSVTWGYRKPSRSASMRIAPLGQPLQHAAQPVQRSRGANWGVVCSVMRPPPVSV